MAKIKKKKKNPDTPEQRKAKKIKRDHESLLRGIFRAAGFSSVSSVANKEFTYDGTKSDFDDIFVYENVIAFCEYTTSQESDISKHLKNKKVLYDKIVADPAKFIDFMRSKFTTFSDALSGVYQKHQFRVVLNYCSLNTVKSETKDEVPNVRYLDYNVARYFDIVTKTVKKSARFEIFDFFGLSTKDVGLGVTKPNSNHTDDYGGSILPEGHSHFDPGFKVVSFYIDPAALLERAYVLRKHGWRAGDTVYQRMISRGKIESVRKYLRDRKRAFINNIIVTLPDGTKLLDEQKNTIDPSKIQETQPAIIQLPSQYNSVGIVDGQHRVFSYHEGGVFDDEISKLRTQQNLLVTGVIFPQGMANEERVKFEAKLFLEINSNQTNARSDLKQEINLVINPFAQESIAKRVVNHLNENTGPLRDEFERYFYDTNKIKTTSVVSFGVRPLVNPNSDDSLFPLWGNVNKAGVKDGADHALLLEYIKFCGSEMNHIFAGARANLPKERWTADRKIPKRFLTTTNINGILACLRRVTKTKAALTAQEYIDKFKGLDAFEFEAYKSSQYNRMGQALYDKFFA